MKKIVFLIVLMLGVGCFAFAEGRLTYEVLKPASNPLPKDVKTLAFVYRNIKFDADSITHFYKYNEETYVDTTDYRKMIAESVYIGFRSKIGEHYPLDTIPFVVLPEELGNAQRIILPLSWDKVNEICKSNTADVLVSLDDISIFNNYETWFDGLEYNGVANITSFNSVTIYDPLTESYIYEKSELDSLQSHKTAYSLQSLIERELPHREEIMKVVGFSIGEHLAEKLVPQWTTIYREYYERGNKTMREAASKVRAEKWEEAIAIWDTLDNEPTDKYKARAAFNKAIIYERLGEIDKALVAILQSINVYKELNKYEEERKLSESMKTILEQREKEIEQLNEQQTEE